MNGIKGHSTTCATLPRSWMDAGCRDGMPDRDIIAFVDAVGRSGIVVEEGGASEWLALVCDRRRRL